MDRSVSSSAAGRGRLAGSLLLFLGAAAATLASCGDRGTAGPSRAGPFAVGMVSVELVDDSRPTAANGAAPALPSRLLRTRIYYPAAGEAGDGEVEGAPPLRGAGPFPLIAFAHGFGAVPEVYRSLYQHWVRSGYVVAAPAFPLTNGLSPGGSNSTDLPNQPADLSFVLDAVAERAAGHGFLSGLVDAGRLGVAGQSLGGMTVLGIAANSCCVDRRLRGAVAMAARLADYPGTFDASIGIPILLVHGDQDPTVSYADGLAAFARLGPPKGLVTILGGDHIIPYVADGSRIETTPNRDASLAFFDATLKDDDGALSRLRAVGELPNATLDLQLD